MSVMNDDRVRTKVPQLGTVALALGCIVVLIAAAFVWSGITTASGRISASTSNDSSLLTAASVDLVVDGGDVGTASRLAIDAAGLYPGLRVERCFAVTFWGNADAVPVRLSGQPGGGTGLEEFVDTRVELGTGSDVDCGDFRSTERLFDDTLLTLWNLHGSYADGLGLMSNASDGESRWVRVSVEVIDDNRAQDLTTAFWLTIEART